MAGTVKIHYMNYTIVAKAFFQDTLDTFKHRVLTILKVRAKLETVLLDSEKAKLMSISELKLNQEYELAYESRESNSQLNYSIKEHLGIDNLQKTYCVEKKSKKVQMICPYLNCERTFTETGNLKTHFRIHVSFFKPL